MLKIKIETATIWEYKVGNYAQFCAFVKNPNRLRTGTKECSSSNLMRVKMSHWFKASIPNSDKLILFF